MIQKKSQIFIFDLIFAFVILVVSVGIIISYFSETTTNLNLYEINYEILDGLTSTRINSLNDDSIREYFRLSLIRNIDNSVAQQIGEFYYIGRDDLARDLSDIFISDYIGGQNNANVTLYDSVTNTTLILFEKNLKGLPPSEATLITSINRTVIGFIDEVDSYGPYIIRITLWI